MHRFTILLFTIFQLFNIVCNAQGITLEPKKPTASEIFENLKKLNFLGTVLYVAAHPDDENTAAIAYFANAIKARTAYLSLTRGDGGQNLIGPELREKLGVIRTQELLAARATDGGEQRFSRANDFGYSKHPNETLKIWDKKAVLSDVVWAIRTLQPDIIINRFDHRTPGTTHGHHTSSALLSVEAFKIAGNASEFKDQLKYTTTWQPKRQFFNTSWWFFGSEEKFEQADKSNMLRLDLGTYYPSLGLSNTEISALSRSQHRCQGFGNTGKRGANDSYFELINGTMPATQNIFEGIDTSWNRVAGGNAVQKLTDRLIATYDFKKPSASIPLLMKVYTEIQKITNTHWKKIKTNEVKNLIAACAGLYLEGVTTSHLGTYGQQIDLKLEAINRSDANIKIEGATLTTNNQKIDIHGNLTNNIPLTATAKFTITKDFNETAAYWLREINTVGMYKVSDQKIIGNPETPIYNKISFKLNIAGTPISIEKPIRYKYNDRVKGEVYTHFEIVPPVAVSIPSKVFIFSEEKPKQITVNVTSNKNNFEGSVFLKHGKGWTVTPQKIDIAMNKNESKLVIFTVTPPNNEDESYITPTVTYEDQEYQKEMVQIKYDHIPTQTLVLPSKTKVVRLNIKQKGKLIGYIKGAGDAIPESLAQIGYTVKNIDLTTLNPTSLQQYDALVLGIRVYNVVPELLSKQAILLEYVENGGTLISQYNTVPRRKELDIKAPYTLKLSRDRVTDENSKVTILKPNHSLMNYPNKITKRDFENWTQERGLYFPNEWSSEYTPLLAMNDEGETSKKGSLLITSYGKGYYIYTGLSFFRELPAGVSGAYKLFANMLSVRKEKK